MQRHFYATSNDLLPVLEQVEKKLLLAYTLTGLFDEDSQTSFFNGASLPTLASSLNVDNAVASPAYLVTERELAVRNRAVQQITGVKKYAIDQLINPDSTVIQHGGLFSPDVLISGRIATTSNTSAALKLQRAFSAAMTKNFTRVKAYWLGSQALKMLQDGARLTAGVHSPKEFDLTLD
jgi:hypothetical protein